MAEDRYDPSDKNTWMWRTEYGYPNGSKPYYYLPDLPEPPPHGYAHESVALRAKRYLCAAVNHYPRFYTGSWCAGYRYVCVRCRMYADPIPKAKFTAMIDDLNQRGGNQEELAAMLRGRPDSRGRWTRQRED